MRSMKREICTRFTPFEEGALHGFAENPKLLEHYIEAFQAEYLGLLHQYQFFIGEEQAKKLLEVYHYEWNKA